MCAKKPQTRNEVNAIIDINVFIISLSYHMKETRSDKEMCEV